MDNRDERESGNSVLLVYLMMMMLDENTIRLSPFRP